MHGHDKQLDPNVKPEHQKVKPAPCLRTQWVQPPMSAAQQAQKWLVNCSKQTLQKSTRNQSEMTNVLTVPETVMRTATEAVTGLPLRYQTSVKEKN